MAFTLAHPAVVLPLRKLPFLALLPLAIGCMTPDLVSFLPYALERYLPHGHSPAGTVLIDLPLGYALLLLLLIFRNALVQPLWEPHREVIAQGLDDFFARPRRWLIAAPSLLIGSWTHLAWDRFTHEDRWTYHNLPALYQPLFPDTAHQLPLFHFLQYSTSVIGLLCIGWHYLTALKQFKASHSLVADLGERRLQLLFALAAASLAIGVVRMLSTSSVLESTYDQIALVLKTAIISFGLLYWTSGILLSRASRS